MSWYQLKPPMSAQLVMQL